MSSLGPGAGCDCGLVDAHTHWVPHQFPAYVGQRKSVAWPSMAPAASACDRNVMLDGRVYRTVSDASWDARRRLQEMEPSGVTHQVVSPMPELLSYWLEADDALSLTSFMNEELAALVAADPAHFTGLGAVPLQDVDLAIRELAYVVETLGFAGVEVGSNINGVPIGAPVFDPFFEACEALGAAVFVHAIRPAGMERLVGPAPLQQVIAYPGDVGLAAASVITSNLMVRRPKLRIAFSHGGGTLASLLPRLQQGWGVFPALRDSVLEAPAEQARRLFYDTLVFDTPTLRHLVARFGDTQLMVGTDHPFNFHDHTPVQRIEAAGFDADTTARLVHQNARRFLGPLPKKVTTP
ncbi:MAG: amidohydrolase [Hydrogenophaga sp.]|uniref:amidohydrolase family protein n=1 Tax=Hydrogenophaga sp. TaxID=1904254 RepID=UPI0026340E6D|nr:amidohydrolase family protein [Hydrogenophaga sp.]MCW5671131.1 amidohydrolase [Hydrogenophaga sp.]